MFQKRLHEMRQKYCTLVLIFMYKYIVQYSYVLLNGTIRYDSLNGVINLMKGNPYPQNR